MKRTIKDKGQKKARKKSRRGKAFLLAILIGIGLGMLFLFRQEIIRPFAPRTTKPTVSKEERNVVLYFSDEDGTFLVGEKKKILKKDRVEEEAKEVIAELIRGPRGKLIPTLPPQTRLLDMKLDDQGVARVSFNKAFTADHPGGSSAEIMTVYSVVNSLATNFPSIKGVQILVEGKEIETIAGHISLRSPISSKLDLIKPQR